MDSNGEIECNQCETSCGVGQRAPDEQNLSNESHSRQKCFMSDKVISESLGSSLLAFSRDAETVAEDEAMESRGSCCRGDERQGPGPAVPESDENREKICVANNGRGDANGKESLVNSSLTVPSAEINSANKSLSSEKANFTLAVPEFEDNPSLADPEPPTNAQQSTLFLSKFRLRASTTSGFKPNFGAGCKLPKNHTDDNLVSKCKDYENKSEILLSRTRGHHPRHPFLDLTLLKPPVLKWSHSFSSDKKAPKGPESSTTTNKTTNSFIPRRKRAQIRPRSANFFQTCHRK